MSNHRFPARPSLWDSYRKHHRHPTNLLLHLLAVPLFILSSLVLLIGLLQLSFVAQITGVIGLVAAVALQRHGHLYEVHQDDPEDDSQDGLKHLLLEQFITFPRFVISGEWWRAWRNRK